MLGMTTIGERIKEARKALGYNYVHVANELKVRWQSVQQWEKKGTGPLRKRMDKLAAFLQVDRIWLETGEGRGPKPKKGEPISGNPELVELFEQLNSLPTKYQERMIGSIRTLLLMQGEPVSDERLKNTAFDKSKKHKS